MLYPAFLSSLLRADALLIAGGIVLVLILVLIGIASIWKKVPQDKALVVTGLKKRIISGGGGLVIPLFERTDVISLENMKLEVRVDGALTEQGVDIIVDGVSVIKVKSDTSSILQAMEQFNTGNEGRTIENVTNTVRDVLEGKLREIISKLTVEEIYKDREKFASEVESTASVALAEMGLELKIFTIRDIADKNQYLESLGKKQIAQVKKDAIIAEAEANKEAAVRTAESTRISQQARLEAETLVAASEKEKELKVQSYRTDQESAKATADNAYAIQQNRVRKEVTETEMQVEILRRQKEIELADQEAIRRERELDATVRVQADADRYQREKNAEAIKFAEIKSAEASAENVKLSSSAKAEAIRVAGLAEAEIIRQKGLAEVEIIREKGKAEAEAMMKKAEAFKQYNDAAVVQMIIDKMPEIALNIASPLSKTEKIVLIGEGGGSKMTRDITNMIAQVPEVTEALTGIDLTQLLKKFVNKEKEA